MTQRDVSTILQRMERMSRAISLGIDVIAGSPRPQVAAALVDTAWEAVMLGHDLTLIVSYDDLWDDLDAVVDVWRQIEAMALQVQVVEAAGDGALVAAASARQTLEEVHTAVRIMDSSLVDVVVNPRDREAWGRMEEAVADLESAADRNFMSALTSRRTGTGTVDSAMALLTTCAARASRERRLVRSQGSQ